MDELKESDRPLVDMVAGGGGGGGGGDRRRLSKSSKGVVKWCVHSWLRVLVSVSRLCNW